MKSHINTEPNVQEIPAVDIKSTSTPQEVQKSINPSIDKGNYLLQVVTDGQIIKEIIALNSTIRITNIGDAAVAAVIK
jgi:hypothetical protein